MKHKLYSPVTGLIIFMFFFLIACQVSFAQERERTAYTISSIDHQYFTAPYERAAVLGGAYMGSEGSPASVILNPAALSSIKKTDTMLTFTQNNYKGIGGVSGKDKNEAISAHLMDTGLYVALPLGRKTGSVLAFGVDTFNTTYNDAPVTEPKGSGSRIYAAYSAPLGKNMTWGYGLMYLDDTYAWGTGWYDGVSFTRYHVKNQSQNWRHRLAVQGTDGNKFTWGVQGTFGYGEGNNYWNGTDRDGKEKNAFTAFRGGAQWKVSPKTRIACDLEWQWIDVQFGNHPASIGYGGGPAYYKGDTLRAMAGMEHYLSDSFSLQGGYKFSSFKIKDLCGRNAQHDASTVSMGLNWKPKGDSFSLSWNGEYTWLGSGDFSQNLAVKCRF